MNPVEAATCENMRRQHGIEMTPALMEAMRSMQAFEDAKRARLEAYSGLNRHQRRALLAMKRRGK